MAQNGSIVDDLNSAKTGQGKIVIYQDDSVKKLLGVTLINNTTVSSSLPDNQLSSNVASPNTSKTQIRARGYRILVYSGSDQKTAKNEANSRKSSVQSAYPNMDVTVSYNSPVWRVKAGNFRTQEQAAQALREMKAKLPSIGREMRIVDDVVKITAE